jgi:regulator of sirC expression with transglutaminase-like and TPR domain
MKIDKSKEFQALINLIDEPDEEMFSIIEKRIIEYGTDILPMMFDALDNNFQEENIERINKIIHEINFSHIASELVKWEKIGAKNLLHGLYLIAKYRYPRIDFEIIKKTIETIKHDIWIEFNKNLTILEKIKVLNHILYDIHGFKPNKTDFHNPSNSYINDVLDKKTGNPILLGALYIVLSQKLELPVYGVNIPEHFICVLINEGKETKLSFLPKKEPLFYINAFNNGVMFSQMQLSSFLKKINAPENPEFFNPCENSDIIIRILHNLSYSYKELKDEIRHKEIEELIKGFNNK